MPAVDQNSDALRQQTARSAIQGHPEIFTRCGAVVASYRTYRGRRLGPFFRLAYRVAGRQRSIYLGPSRDVAGEVRRWLEDLRRPRRLRRALGQQQAAVRASLRAAKADLRRELARVGLRLKGLEVRGWRTAQAARTGPPNRPRPSGRSAFPHLDPSGEAAAPKAGTDRREPKPLECTMLEDVSTFPTQAPDPSAAQRTLHGPAWRWHRAGQSSSRDRCDQASFDDATVQRARHFRRLAGRDLDASKRAGARFDDIAAAVAIQNDPPQEARLKLHVLAGLEAAEIAGRLGLSPTVVVAWERLFFDVRPAMDHRDWLLTAVIQPSLAAGQTELAARMKMIVAGGPNAAQAVLDLDSGLPLEAGQRLFEQELKLALKFEAAMDMPLQSERERLQFVRLYSDIQLERERIRVRERDLELRCRLALERQADARSRLAWAQEQSRARQVERQRREGWGDREQAAGARRAAASPLAELAWGSGAPGATARTTVPAGQRPLGARRAEAEGERPNEQLASPPTAMSA